MTLVEGCHPESFGRAQDKLREGSDFEIQSLPPKMSHYPMGAPRDRKGKSDWKKCAPRVYRLGEPSSRVFDVSHARPKFINFNDVNDGLDWIGQRGAGDLPVWPMMCAD